MKKVSSRVSRLKDLKRRQNCREAREIYAQFPIRYSPEGGWVPLAKSDKVKRIKQNADVFDSSLSGNNISYLTASIAEKRQAWSSQIIVARSLHTRISYNFVSLASLGPL